MHLTTRPSHTIKSLSTFSLAALLCAFGTVQAAVPAAEAEQLKGRLTPFGAERAGNAEGTIPAWTGGFTAAPPGAINGGRRGDPFANEKPLYSVTAKNMDAHAAKLTDGTKALLKRYPDTYRVDVYPTHRTAAAPQWVYDNTLRNATRARLVDGPNGKMPEGAFGGVPFPIPKAGSEVLWNHLLRWRGTAWKWTAASYLVTADGKRVLMADVLSDQLMPYYQKEAAVESFTGDHWMIRLSMLGPAIRAGEAIVSRTALNGEDGTWVYLTGQRRVRKLPNACCDVPNPATGGQATFDETEVFNGRSDRHEWKLLGKKEMLIPYNSNRSLQPKVADLLTPRHLNPDHVRWELHRVWVVEATLREGQRHQAVRNLYYFDEDSWIAVLGDRWDAKGQLWKTLWNLPMAMPDVPATATMTMGSYDLLTDVYFANALTNEKPDQYRIIPPMSPNVYTPDGLVSEGVR